MLWTNARIIIFVLISGNSIEVMERNFCRYINWITGHIYRFNDFSFYMLINSYGGTLVSACK